MGTQMATHQATAFVVAVSDGHAVMDTDCPMMAGTPASKNDTPREDGQSQRSCQSCQLCMPLIALEFLTMDTLASAPQAPGVHGFSRFASADLERDVKPPIT